MALPLTGASAAPDISLSDPDCAGNKRSTPRTHVPNELALIAAAKTQAAPTLHRSDMQEHTNALEKSYRRLRGLRAIPAGNEGSYPFDSCSLRLAINPVKGTRSPQPVENLMEHLLRR
jgi:hypothetical protein